MAITKFGVAVNPADNATLFDSVARTITPPASMVTGDLARLLVHRRGLDDIAMSNTGGQTWTAGTLRQTGSSSAKVFWCRFNGTWSADPSIVSVADAARGIQLKMDVYRPTSGTNTWALDITESYHAFGAPVPTFFDVTATGVTPIAASTVTVIDFLSLDKNTWALQTGGWNNAGIAQYRVNDTSTFKHLSMSSGEKIQTSAVATGNLTNRQLTNGGDAGMWIVNTFKEQSAGVTIASVGDGLVHHGETGIVIAGTSFGASHTGSADVIVSPTDNIADGSAVVQTQTAWANTSVTFTASLSALAYFTNLYVFVKSSTGAANSNGFVIQREALATFTYTLKNLAGSAQASISSIDYSINATGINGTELTSGSSGSTNGSGVITIGPVTLTNTSILNPNTPDDAWITLAKNGASQALSFATCDKITPTYT